MEKENRKSENNIEIISGPLLGDKIVRIKAKEIKTLRRVLGIPALYSMAYGDVGSSIYYALGITAFYALGATPLALAIAGIFFVCTTFTYAEGSSMIPESGGSSSYARRGFNEFVGFVSGWALLLDYIVTIAISAISAAFYLSYFFPVIKEVPIISALIGIGIILFLMILNILGAKESANFNIFFMALGLLTQFSLILLGIILLLDIRRIFGYVNWSGSENWPTFKLFLHAIAVGMVGFMGLETAAQMAEETRRPYKNIPKALILTMLTVVFTFVILPVIALSAMSPQELKNTWYEDAISGIAHYLPDINLDFGKVFKLSMSTSTIMQFWVAILAVTILIIATNAGLTAASRIAFSLASHKSLPPVICKIHSKFRTPYVGIIFFSIVAILLLIPGCFSKGILLLLGDLYRFGGMLAFSLANLSIIALRIKEPDTERPFKAPLNIKILKREIPLTAIFGFLGTFSVFLTILFVNPYGRNVGISWMIFGVIIYITFRVKNKLPIFESVKGIF